MKDNPYVLILEPDEFQDLYDEIACALEWENPDTPIRYKTLQRLMKKLKQADKEHPCVDEENRLEKSFSIT